MQRQQPPSKPQPQPQRRPNTIGPRKLRLPSGPAQPLPPLPRPTPPARQRLTPIVDPDQAAAAERAPKLPLSRPQLVYPTRCPHCGQTHDGLRPIGAQIVRAARTVARLALRIERMRRAPGALLSDARTSERGDEAWITAADVCRATPGCTSGGESTISLYLHRGWEAGLLTRRQYPASSHGGRVFAYRSTALLAAYVLPGDDGEEGETDSDV